MTLINTNIKLDLFSELNVLKTLETLEKIYIFSNSLLKLLINLLS